MTVNLILAIMVYAAFALFIKRCIDIHYDEKIRLTEEKLQRDLRRIDEDHAVVMLGIGLRHSAGLQKLGVGRVRRVSAYRIYDVN